MAIGCGLISTFTIETSTGVWIGYQIIAGAGRGCGLQMVCFASKIEWYLLGCYIY